MPGKRYLFVMHGERAAQPALRHLVSWVREKGYEVDVRVTWEQGDGVRFARAGARRRVDAVVALGGDGTVNEVLNGLAGSRVPLGIIPVGTANDFARQVGIPDDPDHAMDCILRRKPVPIDAGSLNGRRFLNVSSGGVGAEATAETPTEAKASLGPLAYAITGARKLGALQPSHARFSAPGFRLACDFLLFAVGNARCAGGGALVAPRASIADGLLDVCIVEAMPLKRFARLLLKLRRGEHVGEPGVHYLQLPSLAVRAERELAVNLDGEPITATTLLYRARPHAVLAHLPHLPGDGDEG